MSDLRKPDEPLFRPDVPASIYATRWAGLRRLCPALLFDRVSRPVSRWRHARADKAVAARFTRPPLSEAPASEDVCIVGALSSRNGLSRGARYELDRLMARYPGAHAIDVTKGKRGAFADYAATRRANPPAMVIFLLQPNTLWRTLRDVEPAFLRDAYRIVMAVWELPYFPPGWSLLDGFVHEYWTPTAFSAGALAQGTRQRIRVVPHPVSLTVPENGAPIVPRARFAGLALMDLSTCPDRKNPWAHVEAWQKAFGHDADCVLTLKLRFSARTAPVRRELNGMIGAAPNIRIVERDLSDAEVARLQADSDVSLSLHRAEGFGLTICEMLERGKAAVATDWSGNVEFMGRSAKAYPVRYTLVPYRDGLRRYPGYRGTWAEADTDHAARCLRAAALACRAEKRAPREQRPRSA